MFVAEFVFALIIFENIGDSTYVWESMSIVTTWLFALSVAFMLFIYKTTVPVIVTVIKHLKPEYLIDRIVMKRNDIIVAK